MIVVFPFSLQDVDLALKNARWINELGGVRGHQALCCYDVRCNPEVVKEIQSELMKGFDPLYILSARAAIDGWPQGANYLFRTCTAWLQNHSEWPYFFWMEPDAIPLAPGWLDALESEYNRAARLFMGDRVEVEGIPLHMSGVGIYPNPLHAHAGEAYRAFDIAWDMVAKDQIVPQAHFTKLIEHAWRHPVFTATEELTTQIRPEAVLFHSSKDGSLIDLLQRDRKKPVEPRELLPGSPAPSATCDMFIRTYPGDYEWLRYSLKSIAKYVSGFRKIWIVSPADPPSMIAPEHEWKVMNEEAEDHYLSQQIHKLYADTITDYQADYILHVDSDVIFQRPTTPGDFFSGDKPIWYYTPYSEIQTPWQPITEKFLGKPITNEFMRRFPILVPRWLYPRIREFCHKQHGIIISDYIRMQPLRAFSEFNALGAYAWTHHREMFEWINTIETRMPVVLARQYHSWGGITDEIKSEIETTLRGAETVHAHQAAAQVASTQAASSASPHLPAVAGIKELPNGIWVIEDDTHISKWVEQQGRLDHDQNLLPFILPHIKSGDTVIDAGAFIGDHTIAYTRAVGEKGKVYAFEPNPIAFKCLLHNLRNSANVFFCDNGLSDKANTVPLSGNNGNYGGCYAGEHMKIADVEVVALETVVPWQVNFIKLDIEGYELKALRGAGNLIDRCRPKMVIEINYEALKRQGDRAGDIYAWLEEHEYDWKIIQENCCGTSPLYDILCLPKKQPPEQTEENASSSPVAATPELSVGDHVRALREYADGGRDQLKYVRRLLRQCKVMPEWQKPK